MLLLLSLSGTGGASASDVQIGTTKRFGVGASLGFPPSASMKMLFDRTNGLTFHVGPTLATSGLHLRLQFEQNARELKTWSWGELWLSWNVGVIVNFVFGEQAAREPVRPGIMAGVGVDLRLVPAPISVFGELSPMLFPLDIAPAEANAFLPVGVVVVVGARAYF